MIAGNLAKSGLAGVVVRWACGLRFPCLFVLSATLFVLNLSIPDVVPFANELFTGLVTVLLGSVRRRVATEPEPAASTYWGASPG